MEKITLKFEKQYSIYYTALNIVFKMQSLQFMQLWSLKKI